MTHINKLSSLLLESQVQSQVFHTRVNGQNAHEAHIILEEYYNSIRDLNDGLIESYQGKYHFVTFSEELTITNLAKLDAVVKYFEQLSKDVEILYSGIDEGFLESQVDDILSLIYTTIYKLKHLK